MREAVFYGHHGGHDGAVGAICSIMTTRKKKDQEIDPSGSLEKKGEKRGLVRVDLTRVAFVQRILLSFCVLQRFLLIC